MTDSRAGFAFEFVDNGSSRTLLLLHGTGGSEQDMIGIGSAIDPAANLLAPRGTVLEDGMTRFFKRKAPGVFDRADLRLHTQELNAFITEMIDLYEIDRDGLIGIGYSNGANILLHLLCLFPESIAACALLRPMPQALADDLPALTDHDILVAAGESDPMIPFEDATHLALALKEAGAKVTFFHHQNGHRLVGSDLSAVERWLRARQ